MISEAFVCLVVAISDGDTIKARCGEPGAYQEVKVRLAEIDAPEKRQAYGEASKRTLAALCAGVQAKITPETTDRYGRTVAHVECRGQDANTEQVRAGMAWVYDRYAKNQWLYTVQDAARLAGRGLWSEKAPIAPWEFRHPKR
ncbi:thermonuclease family protein [Curvibacter sp. HBC28]|uniref:Thermonuclease family protein n=1 Tax=Curvibacter microcysteis TaxID=3026419 RepID=A0ABT5MD42_9BURK|nr:thermonuclease family protein [Curvibacter sp. HBC28]MDD0814300.1 thermonuclease family protein [Curvibacter sp. HBC28]